MRVPAGVWGAQFINAFEELHGYKSYVRAVLTGCTICLVPCRNILRTWAKLIENAGLVDPDLPTQQQIGHLSLLASQSFVW